MCVCTMERSTARVSNGMMDVPTIVCVWMLARATTNVQKSKSNGVKSTVRKGNKKLWYIQRSYVEMLILYRETF